MCRCKEKKICLNCNTKNKREKTYKTRNIFVYINNAYK